MTDGASQDDGLRGGRRAGALFGMVGARALADAVTVFAG